MCKSQSFIKITILIFFILYTFEVNAIENGFKNGLKNGNDTSVELATPSINVNTTDFSINSNKTGKEEDEEDESSDKTSNKTSNKPSNKNQDKNPDKKVEADLGIINGFIDDNKEGSHITEEYNPIIPATRTTRRETKTTTVSYSEKTPEATNASTVVVSEPTAEPSGPSDNYDDQYHSDTSSGVASVANGKNENPFNNSPPSNESTNSENPEESSSVLELLKKFTSLIIAVGAVSVGLVAVSGYKVLKKKSEKTLKSTELYSASTPPSLMRASDYNNPRLSLVNSLISEAEQEGNMLYYAAKNQYNESEVIQHPGITIEPSDNEIPCVPYRLSLQSEGSTSDKSVTVISVNRNSIISRNSVIRHSFLNPNINIIRTGKRTQQLFEATSEHPAIIETFPSLERPFVPSVPVPLEECDGNSLHPHSIYQMYQDEMEYENYYAYTIEDKEYIIDPTNNRVLEIHDLNTDEYMLVEEELYLDFSGSSDDSDSDKQTL